MVILKYRLTEEDFFNFYYYTGWAAPNKRGYRIRYVLRIIGLYSLLAGLYLFTISKNDTSSKILFFVVPALVYFLLIPTLVKRGIRQRSRAMLAKPENRNMLDDAELVVMDTGILAKDSLSETKYSWDAIVRKDDTPSYYYLYTNSAQAIVIPKRVIKIDRERQELQQLFSQHLSLSSEFPEK